MMIFHRHFLSGSLNLKRYGKDDVDLKGIGRNKFWAVAGDSHPFTRHALTEAIPGQKEPMTSIVTMHR
jgi:hypothetical protein